MCWGCSRVLGAQALTPARTAGVMQNFEIYLVNLLSCKTGLFSRLAETIVAASGKRTEIQNRITKCTNETSQPFTTKGAPRTTTRRIGQFQMSGKERNFVFNHPHQKFKDMPVDLDQTLTQRERQGRTQKLLSEVLVRHVKNFNLRYQA